MSYGDISKYVRLSSWKSQPHSLIVTSSYSFHQLDLRPDLGTLLRSFHKSSTQRKIRRAEREGLTYRRGIHRVTRQLLSRC